MKKQIVITAISSVAILMLLLVLILRPSEMTNEELSENGLYIHDVPRPLNEFSLIDQNNNSINSGLLQNQWTLIFFGYTYCPDICPLTMSILNQFSGILNEEGSYADDTQIIMVSVDPRRDTPEKLEEYVGFFNDDYLGLSGEYIEIFKFASQLNIAFAYAPGEDEDYLVSHSGEIVLINPNGEFHGFFKVPHDPESMAFNYQAVRSTWD
ncbi:MAG: SCO family protein [Gammaproteobacteria bacterium]|jgi:protein SCO1|nr:SCO family protein [Gammaproteobacteria bacterium]